MATPFIGEIRMMSFNFPPKGWALCDGQFLPINQNQALFSLLGTTYGGDGRTNFALPNFKGRVPIHVGQGHTLGERAGTESHTLTLNELPQHVHTEGANTNPASTGTPSSSTVLGKSVGANLYASASSVVPMAASALGNSGGSQAHENRQPFLALNFSISLQGIFPSRN